GRAGWFVCSRRCLALSVGWAERCARGCPWLHASGSERRVRGGCCIGEARFGGRRGRPCAPDTPDRGALMAAAAVDPWLNVSGALDVEARGLPRFWRPGFEGGLACQVLPGQWWRTRGPTRCQPLVRSHVLPV